MRAPAALLAAVVASSACSRARSSWEEHRVRAFCDDFGSGASLTDARTAALKGHFEVLESEAFLWVRSREPESHVVCHIDHDGATTRSGKAEVEDDVFQRP
jgi:hypothetical protein